jgi:hypothetical protein
LDIAKLHTLNLARDRAELARRIDLHFDAAARCVLDLLLIEFDELMLRFVDGRGADLHDEIGGGGR